MSTLELLRTEIDEVDTELAALFVKRMEIVKRIAAEKKEQGLPILDEARENEILATRTSAFARADLLPYYQEFLGSLLTLSKDYQRRLGGKL